MTTLGSILILNVTMVLANLTVLIFNTLQIMKEIRKVR
jgi:hypothetical protein